MDPSVVCKSTLPVQYDAADAIKRIGLLALATDLTIERDFARIIPPDRAGVYATRVAYENPTTLENLRRMVPRLTAATELILPGETLDVVCYGCTAASVVIGDDEIAAAVHVAKPGVPVVTPTGAARMAFAALGVTRIAVLTPYLIETSRPMAAYFTRHGFEVTRLECFGLEDDRAMGRVCREIIVDAACRVDRPEAEAVFVSCTALPAVTAIAEIEARTGKPVVTSNQASAWQMMRHAGLDDRPQGFGRLFDLGLPRSDNGRVA